MITIKEFYIINTNCFNGVEQRMFMCGPILSPYVTLKSPYRDEALDLKT